jgi:predicted nucleic acid-binding protein
MITAVDTDVLLDVLVAGSSNADGSEDRLAVALGQGALVVSPIVAAELAAQFQREAELKRFLYDTGVRVDSLGLPALLQAGQAWRRYHKRRQPEACPACGAPLPHARQMMSDFLVGGHALAQADRLLTRGHEFYRAHFPRLKLAP